LVVCLIALALLGAPLFTILAGAAILGFTQQEIDLAILGVELYRLVDTPILLALPLFTYAGYVWERGRPHNV
jgi:C4-dicarboxylate transporter DctM subunit